MRKRGKYIVFEGLDGLWKGVVEKVIVDFEEGGGKTWTLDTDFYDKGLVKEVYQKTLNKFYKQLISFI